MPFKLPFKKDEFFAIFQLAIPILLTQLFLVGMGATDVAITGHFDTVVQASVGLGVMIWNPLFLFGGGVLISVSILSAHKFGAGKLDEVATIWHNGVIIALLLSLILVLIMNFGTEHILNFVNAEPHLTQLTTQYLKFLSIGAPGMLLFISLRAVYEGLSRPLLITWVSGIGFVINALLNYTLVHGFPPLGIKSYGIVGSGLGTAITIWIMFFLLLGFSHFDVRLQSLQLIQTKFRWTNIFAELLRLGLPSGATLFAEIALFSGAGLILGRYAELVVASHQISLQMASLTFMVPLSISIALTALVGQRMGRDDYFGARSMGNTGLTTLVGIVILTSAFLYFARFQVVMLFTTNVDVIVLSAKLILFAVVFQIPDVFQVAANGILRGMKDTKIPMYLCILSYWCIAFPLCYYLGVTLEYEAEGVWLGLIIGLTVSALLLNGRLLFLKRRYEAELTQLTRLAR